VNCCSYSKLYLFNASWSPLCERYFYKKTSLWMALAIDIEDCLRGHDAATRYTTCRVSMPISYNYPDFNGLYFNGFYISTAGNFNAFLFQLLLLFNGVLFSTAGFVKRHYRDSLTNRTTSVSLKLCKLHE
jgi:hypothetical protein